MTIVILDTPVFQVTTEAVNQIVSYDTQTSGYKLINVDTGVPTMQHNPLMASDIYFMPERRARDKRFPNGESKALEYMLNMGVGNIREIPEHWLQRRSAAGIQVLLHTLEEIELVNHIESQYIPEFKANVIMDQELVLLCNSVIFNRRGKPVQHIIDILSSRGFKVRPLSPIYGWDITVVETSKGLIILT